MSKPSGNSERVRGRSEGGKTVNGVKVAVFFYGSYINFDVLKEVDLVPESYDVARLGGFDIVIRPLANLVRSDRHTVYGIATRVTHAELARLYDHAEQVLGGIYLPEAVICQTEDGKFVPALCYVAPSMDPKPADNDYVDRIVGPARGYGFPGWYIARLESFKRTTPAPGEEVR